MKEQLISFDTAKLAKEKGFDWECRDFWNPTQDNKLKEDALLENYNEKHNISAPTQSLLQKWLREIHKIDLYCDCIGGGRYFWFIYSNTNNYIAQQDEETSYEEALEKGLYQALLLIKS